MLMNTFGALFTLQKSEQRRARCMQSSLRAKFIRALSSEMENKNHTEQKVDENVNANAKQWKRKDC